MREDVLAGFSARLRRIQPTCNLTARRPQPARRAAPGSWPSRGLLTSGAIWPGTRSLGARAASASAGALVHGAVRVLVVRARPPPRPAHHVALFFHHELPGPVIAVRHEVIVLVEGNMLFHRGALIRLYRAPLAEEAVEAAVFRRRALRADLGRIEGEGISLHQHI